MENDGIFEMLQQTADVKVKENQQVEGKKKNKKPKQNVQNVSRMKNKSVVRRRISTFGESLCVRNGSKCIQNAPCTKHN